MLAQYESSIFRSKPRLPVGLIMTLIPAAILRKKRKADDGDGRAGEAALSQ